MKIKASSERDLEAKSEVGGWINMLKNNCYQKYWKIFLVLVGVYQMSGCAGVQKSHTKTYLKNVRTVQKEKISNINTYIYGWRKDSKGLLTYDSVEYFNRFEDRFKQASKRFKLINVTSDYKSVKEFFNSCQSDNLCLAIKINEMVGADKEIYTSASYGTAYTYTNTLFSLVPSFDVSLKLVVKMPNEGKIYKLFKCKSKMEGDYDINENNEVKMQDRTTILSNIFEEIVKQSSNFINNNFND